MILIKLVNFSPAKILLIVNYRWQKRILKTSSINYLLKVIKNVMKKKKEKKRWPLLSTIWKVLNPPDVSVLGRGVHLLLGVHPIGSCPLTGGVQLTEFRL